LGISKFKRGYWYYSSSTHRFYVFVDVIFLKDAPFFASSATLDFTIDVTHYQVLPIPLPPRKSIVDCQWVFAITVGLDVKWMVLKLD